MANDLTFLQASTLLNEIQQQLTGRISIAPTNTYEFVTVAQTALKQGYDPLLGAISAVLTRSIFSIRPYSAKFRSLQVDEQKFGGITRKFQISDKDWEKDQRYDLEDGKSVDMFKVNKPIVLQTNFYGQNVYQRHYTLFKDQLDIGFTGPDQFARFVTMVVQNCSDIIEQSHEGLKRYTIANFIAGKTLADPDSVIHLITEYNQISGEALTPQTVYSPQNFKPFIQWAKSRIATLTKLMTERTEKWHVNLTGKPVNRHTPLRLQKIYMYQPIMDLIDTMAMADTFHDSYLKMATNEGVGFWQSVDVPNQIQVAPVYLNADGSLTNGGVTQVNNLMGIIFDEEAMGMTTINSWSAPTPFNAAGGYTNIYFHYTDRYWNDYMENAIILLLD